MAKRRRGKASGRSPSIPDVLAERVRIDPLDLVALIHRVNPTDRTLSNRERRRRYRDKAALQSLLVRRAARGRNFGRSSRRRPLGAPR
jgi:hypothetical protein